MTQAQNTSRPQTAPDPSVTPAPERPRSARTALSMSAAAFGFVSPTSAYQRRIAESLSADGPHARAMREQLESEQAHMRAQANGDHAGMAEQVRVQRSLGARFRRIRAQLRKPARPPRIARHSPGTVPPTSTREQIRRNSIAHQTQGPPPPLLEAIEAAIATFDTARAAFVDLRDQIIATTEAPASDAWIGQRESPLQPRVFTKRCRDLMAQGDPRAAVRGRVHYLQQSAITEFLRGQPHTPKPKPKPERPLSAGERLRLELEGPSWAEQQLERAIMARPASRRER